MVLLTLSLAGTAMFLFATDTPKAGAAAPTFKLNSQEGRPVSLDQFQGKWVVLYFYPKDFTSGCTVEAHNFQRDEAKYAEANAAIVGVSVDTVDSHQQFCTKEGLNFKLLSDPDGAVSKAYGSLNNLGVTKFSKRHTFLISPDGKIAKVYTDVKPSGHSQEVLADLAQLEKKS